MALNERERLRECLGHLGGRRGADATLGRSDGVGAREIECSHGSGVVRLGRGQRNGLPGRGKGTLRVVEGVRALGRVGAVQVLIIPEKPVSDASIKSIENGGSLMYDNRSGKSGGPCLAATRNRSRRRNASSRPRIATELDEVAVSSSENSCRSKIDDMRSPSIDGSRGVCRRF